MKKNNEKPMFSDLTALKRAYRQSGDAYSKPIRKSGDCHGAVDNKI